MENECTSQPGTCETTTNVHHEGARMARKKRRKKELIQQDLHPAQSKASDSEMLCVPRSWQHKSAQEGKPRDTLLIWIVRISSFAF